RKDCLADVRIRIPLSVSGSYTSIEVWAGEDGVDCSQRGNRNGSCWRVPGVAIPPTANTDALIRVRDMIVQIGQDSKTISVAPGTAATCDAISPGAHRFHLYFHTTDAADDPNATWNGTVATVVPAMKGQATFRGADTFVKVALP